MAAPNPTSSSRPHRATLARTSSLVARAGTGEMDVQDFHPQLGGGAGSKRSMGVGVRYEALNGTLKGSGRVDEPVDAFAAVGTLPSPPPSTQKRPRPRMRPTPSPGSPTQTGRAQSRPISSLSLAESFSSPPPPAYDSIHPSSPSPPSPTLSRSPSPTDDAQLDDLITLTRSLLLSSQAILRDGEDVRVSLERIVRSGSPPRIGSGFLGGSGRVEGGGGMMQSGGEEDEERLDGLGGSDVAARRDSAVDVAGGSGDETRSAIPALNDWRVESSRPRTRTAAAVFPADPRAQAAASKANTAHRLLSRVALRQGGVSKPAATAAIAFDTSSTFELRTPPSPPETPVKALNRPAPSSSLLSRYDTANSAALRARSSHTLLADSDSKAHLESPAPPATPIPVSTPPDTPRRLSQVAGPPTPSSISSSQFSSSSRRPILYRRTSTVSSVTTTSTFTSTHRSATTASLSLSSFDELLESSLSSGTMSSDSTQGGGQSQARDRLKALVDGPTVAAEKGASAEGGEKAAASSSWWGWRQG